MIALLRIRFPETDSSRVWDDQTFQYWMHRAVGYSLGHFWWQSGWGYLDIDYEIFPPLVIRDPRPSSVDTVENRDALVNYVIDQATQQLSPDWSRYDRIWIWAAQQTTMFGGRAYNLPLAGGGTKSVLAAVFDINSPFDGICEEAGHSFSLSHERAVGGGDYGSPYSVMSAAPYGNQASSFLRRHVSNLPDGIRLPNDSMPFPGLPPQWIIGPLLCAAQLYAFDWFRDSAHVISIPRYSKFHQVQTLYALDYAREKSQTEPLAALAVAQSFLQPNRFFFLEFRRGGRGYDSAIGSANGPPAGVVVHYRDSEGGLFTYEGVAPIQPGASDWVSPSGQFTVHVEAIGPESSWVRFSIGGGLGLQTVAPARISSASRSADHLDLFVTDSAGNVCTTFWDQEADWFYRWWSLGDSNFFDDFTIPPGAPITVLTRSPDRLDLFVSGRDGGIYTKPWQRDTQWEDRWSRLFDNRFWDGFTISPGANVTAIARQPDRLDLFVVGRDGAIYTTAWHQGDRWTDEWRRISDDRFADRFQVPADSAISVVARAPDRLDLFVTGRSGAVYTQAWQAARDWTHEWRRLDDPRYDDGFEVLQATVVTAISRSADRIDLFVTGRDGAIFTTHWSEAHDWTRNWDRLLDDRFSDRFAISPGAAVTALSRRADRMDLFVVAREGGIFRTAYHEPTGWTYEWLRLEDTDYFDGFTVPVGSVVSSVARGEDHIDLFVVGRTGNVYTTSWDARTGWFPHWFAV